MNEKEVQAATFIEKSVSGTWRDFTASHDKLIIEAIKQAKGIVTLTEERIESIRQKVSLKLNPALDNMSQFYSDYREQMNAQLSAFVREELKKLIDLHMGEAGFQADEKNLEPLEPRNNVKELSQMVRTVVKDELKDQLSKFEKSTKLELSKVVG